MDGAFAELQNLAYGTCLALTHYLEVLGEQRQSELDDDHPQTRASGYLVDYNHVLHFRTAGRSYRTLDLIQEAIEQIYEHSTKVIPSH